MINRAKIVDFASELDFHSYLLITEENKYKKDSLEIQLQRKQEAENRKNKKPNIVEKYRPIGMRREIQINKYANCRKYRPTGMQRNTNSDKYF